MVYGMLMQACLNPIEPHSARQPSSQWLVCAEPRCGYLLSGAVINHWQVTTLLGRGPLADLYLAVDREPRAPSAPSQMLVKVLRAAQAGPQTLIEQQLERLLALRHPHIHSLQVVGWTAPTG